MSSMRIPRVRPSLANRHRARSIDVVFTDDRCISGLAGRYRGSRRATDVLAFTYGDDGMMPYGEIVVSLDTAARQAMERGVHIEDEVLLLVLHGLLHIAGQGDETYGDWCTMRRLEFEALMRIL